MLRSGNYGVDNFTLHYWIGESNKAIASGDVGVLRNTRILSALKNSVVMSVAGALIAAFIGLIIGYAVVRGSGSKLSRMIDQLTFIPHLIPSIAFSAVYLAIFAKKSPFIPALYGTLGLLILITVVKQLPFATRSGTSTMILIGKELEEAGLIQGANWFQRFRRILLPLCNEGLVSSFILVFISAMKELDLILLLITPKTYTLTALTFDYAGKGYEIGRASCRERV